MMIQRDAERISDLRRWLQECHQNQLALVRHEHYWVARLRELGISWGDIGLDLGISRQAAWERFSGHERDSELRDEERDAVATEGRQDQPKGEGEEDPSQDASQD